MYAPSHHADALDPIRVLVIGSRGVGKSFWASVLNDHDARQAAAVAYPRLGLDRLKVALGFHEGASGTDQVAPSPEALRVTLESNFDATAIWRSVVLKALNPSIGPRLLKDRARWVHENPEEYEDHILTADQRLSAQNETQLIIFDALDVLAPSWDTIRTLTLGIAKVASEMGARRAIRLKMFMRKDQFEDMRTSTFSDFSKLRTASVTLDWEPVDLYGSLFSRLWRNTLSANSFKTIVRSVGISSDEPDLPYELQAKDEYQERVFAQLAGEFMGANKKRGRTYTWMPKHLADAHEETSLRSFLIALREAAERAPHDRPEPAIDAQGINAGVLRASDTRLEELREDNPWVEDALKSLEGLIVPCAPDEIFERWRERGVVNHILSKKNPGRPTAPIRLSGLDMQSNIFQEGALLESLFELGVAEPRNNNRVNVPDIFRVAARMKRRGGVAPRKKV
jgi:hypothetical protein